MPPSLVASPIAASPHVLATRQISSRPESSSSVQGWRWVVLLAAVLAAAVLLIYYGRRQQPVLRLSNYVQLTRDGEPKTLVGTDGSRLYFRLGTKRPCGRGGVHLGGDPFLPCSHRRPRSPQRLSRWSSTSCHRQAWEPLESANHRWFSPSPGRYHRRGRFWNGCRLVSRRKDAGLYQPKRLVSGPQRWHRSSQAGLGSGSTLCPTDFA